MSVLKRLIWTNAVDAVTPRASMLHKPKGKPPGISSSRRRMEKNMDLLEDAVGVQVGSKDWGGRNIVTPVGIVSGNF